MNIKDFTLKISYLLPDGSEHTVTINDGLHNFNDDVGVDGELCFYEDGASDAVHITLKTQKPVKLTLAELIYDHYFESDEWFFANGYQSWTTTREYKRGDYQNGLRGPCRLPFARKYAGVSGDYNFTEYGRDLYHGFTYSYLRKGDRLELLGSLNERTGYTIFYADMRDNVFAVVKDVEGLNVDDKYELFDIVRIEGSYDEAFDKYFEAYPLKTTGRVKHFAGYTSWYNYFQNINEEIILRDLKGLARAGKSANIFQIDDGYETYVGDWDIDTSKFPNGLMPIVEKIHAQNLKAGLWIAPFAAEFKSNVVKNHPEWLIKDANGKPQFSGVAWGGFYALDIELQPVRDYIRAYFDKVFDEWGFDMVKLDFLYSACIFPRNGKTRGQLMCEAMDFLRECCRDNILLGCGVPLGPSFGIVDACRIGCDVGLNFKDYFYVPLTNQEIISARHAMNNSIFRRHLNGRIMANDPDVFFLRDDGKKPVKFTMEQKKLLAKINNMFGSVLFVSDNINAYDDEKLQILLDSYKPFGGKIYSAEYISGSKIAIVYDDGKGQIKFTFDTFTGESHTQTL